MTSGIVIFKNTVVASGDDLIIFYYTSAKWSAVSVFDAGFGFFDGQFHEFWLVHGFIITFYGRDFVDFFIQQMYNGSNS